MAPASRRRVRNYQLLEHAWNYDYENRSNVVDVYVRYLRKKIDRPFGVESIETIRGAGYRLSRGRRTKDLRSANLISRRSALIALTLLIAIGLFAFTQRPVAPAPIPVPNRAFTSPKPELRRATVWGVGDGANGSAAARRIGELVAAGKPDRVLYLGDVYESGTRAEFNDNFAGVYGSLTRRIAPTPGNHDWPNHDNGYDPYWRSVTGAATPPWYAFRIAGWQILSLNSEAPHGHGSPQVRWLRRRVRKPGSCRLAFWHRPRFSAGSHGDQADVAPLWKVLVGRAVIVLSGHDHNLQRFRPLAGITQIVAGAGGRSHYELDGADQRLAFADDELDGAARLTLRPGSARIDLVAADGMVLDSSTVACR